MGINKITQRQVGVTLSIEEKEQLDKIAQKENRTTSNLAGYIIKRFLEEYTAGKLDASLNPKAPTTKPRTKK